MDSAPPDWGSRARGLSCLYGGCAQSAGTAGRSARAWMGDGAVRPSRPAPAPYQLSRTRHIVSPKGEPNTQTIARLPGLIVVAYRSGFLTLIAVTLQSPASLLPTDQTLHSLRLTSSPPQTPTVGRDHMRASWVRYLNLGTPTPTRPPQIRRWRRVGG